MKDTKLASGRLKFKWVEFVQQGAWERLSCTDGYGCIAMS